MQRNNRHLWLLTLTTASIMAVPVAARADDNGDSKELDTNYLQVGIGADYSSGNYGDTQKTDILAVPFSVKYKQGNFYLRASIPYLHVKGPGNVVPGDGGPVSGGTAGAVRSQDGIGDLTLTAGYTIPFSSSTFFDLNGRVKVPTASESKGLGTGTTDFTAQGELTQRFGPLFASVRGGRRFNGSNTLFPLHDVWQAGGSLYYQANRLTLGVDYDWRDAPLLTASDRSEVTGSISYKLTPAVRLQGYGYFGLANGSPDTGGGMQLLYRFGI